ncbi:MAG TPA: hypothetical protein PLU10_12625 [Chitinophagaceae bacterium]|nr:hypothetical protein [Chitinophagaceae bacterium]
MKPGYLFFLLITLPSFLFAQDIIYPKKGDSIAAKVLSIKNDEVIYKRFDNISGPDYSLNTHQINRIVYENKTVENFSTSSTSTKSQASTLGHNKISLHPISMYGTENKQYLIAGLDYERLLFKNAIGIRIGGLLAFDQTMSAMDYAVKYYPVRSNTFQYYTGLSGQSGLFYHINMSKKGSDAFNSVMLINGLSAQLNRNFYIGLHTGIGMCYQNVLIPDLYAIKHDWVQGIGYQVALELGVRF